MLDVSGYYFIDGIDLWTTFGLVVEEGSADMLQYAPKKESIKHDWMDSNGVEVDLSRIFFGPREIILKCAILCESEEEFWEKHDDFISHLIQPGKRRLSIKAHGERSYYVYYKECNNYTQVKALQGIDTPKKVAARFSLVLEEPEPQVDASHTFLITEEGHFIIT